MHFLGRKKWSKTNDYHCYDQLQTADMINMLKETLWGRSQHSKRAKFSTKMCDLLQCTQRITLEVQCSIKACDWDTKVAQPCVEKM